MCESKRVLASLLLSLVILLANARGEEAKSSSQGERFRQFLAEDWKRRMENNPEFATFIGYPGYNHRWTDQSWEGIQQRHQRKKESLEKLESFDRSQLGPSDKLNYDLYRKNLRQRLESDLYPRGLKGEPGFGGPMPVNQLGGPQQRPAHVIDAMPTSTVKQYESIVARLEALPTYIMQNLELMRRGLARGLTPPKITLRNVPEQVQAQMVGEPMESPLLRPFKKFADSIPEQDRNKLTATAKKTYTEGIRPAYQQLHDYLVKTYIPAAREETAHNALPDGKAWYTYLVLLYTSTDLNPEQIHETGLAEVKRIRVEMNKIIRKTGFEGSLAEFRRFLQSDPQFFYTDKEELLRDYRATAKRADAATVKLFRRLPRLPYAIRPVPRYAEKSAPGAYFRPGSVQSGRPGTFFVNTYDLKSRPKWEMEALILHEAVPGHHFQNAISLELEGLPEFRKRNYVGAYIEGWGLYAETLGEEIGFLEDPYSKFGQLNYEIFRSARLVVDTGLHAKGWSRQQAIDFLKENTALPEHSIVVEVDRYLVIPGQALAYKFGQLKISALRQYASRELGDAFDLRAFHDQVLGNGALPLDILEAHIKEWVARQKVKSEKPD